MYLLMQLPAEVQDIVFEKHGTAGKLTASYSLKLLIFSTIFIVLSLWIICVFSYFTHLNQTIDPSTLYSASEYSL